MLTVGAGIFFYYQGLCVYFIPVYFIHHQLELCFAGRRRWESRPTPLEGVEPQALGFLAHLKVHGGSKRNARWMSIDESPEALGAVFKTFFSFKAKIAYVLNELVAVLYQRGHFFFLFSQILTNAGQ